MAFSLDPAMAKALGPMAAPRRTVSLPRSATWIRGDRCSTPSPRVRGLRLRHRQCSPVRYRPTPCARFDLERPHTAEHAYP